MTATNPVAPSRRTADRLVWLYDSLAVPVLPVHKLIDLEVDDRLGAAESITFTMLRNDPKAAFLQPDQIVRWNNRLYRNIDQRDLRVGSQLTVQVYCEALWYDLQKRVRVGNFPVLGKTPEEGLIAILNNTGWSVGDAPLDSNLYSSEGNDSTIIQLLRQWAAVTGYELTFNTALKEVSLVAQIGETQPLPFRYGRNVTDIERRYEPPQSTRLYPFGAGSLDITANEPSGNNYIEDYTWYTDTLGITLAEARARYRKDQVWVDQRYLLGINLYDAALTRLARLAQPVISYSLNVIDLSGADAEAVDYAVGDTVRVTDDDLGIDIKTRVVRRLRKPLRPQDSALELAYLRPGLTDSELALDQRDINYGEIAVLVDENTDPITVTSGVTAWATILITVAGTTTPVLGGTFVGVATGTGVLSIWATLDGTDIGARIDVQCVDGQQVEVSWPTYIADIAEGTYTLEWRATVTSGSIAVGASNARAWALVRGAVGVGFATTPNQSIAEEMTAYVPTSMSTSASAFVSDSDNIEDLNFGTDETVTAYVPNEIVDDFLLPFTLGNDTFGRLGGPARLNPPGATE